LQLWASVEDLERCVREERRATAARRLSDERRLEEAAKGLRCGLEEVLAERQQELERMLLEAGERHLQDLGRRIDLRLEDLERTAGKRGGAVLEEVREGLRQLQTDAQGFHGRLEKCTLAEDLEEHFRLADRFLQKRLDERLGALESRTGERCARLEGCTEVVGRRCLEVERLLSERFVEQAEQRWPGSCELWLSRIPALEAKVELVEAHVARQAEEQAQTVRQLQDLAQRLPQASAEANAALEAQLAQQAEDQVQTSRCLRELARTIPLKLADVEAACHRAEDQANALEERLRVRVDEDGGRAAADLEALQRRLAERVEDAEARLQRTAERLEREGTAHVEVLTKKASEAEERLRELEAQGDRLVLAGIRRLEEHVAGPLQAPQVQAGRLPEASAWQPAPPQAMTALPYCEPLVHQALAPTHQLPVQPGMSPPALHTGVSELDSADCCGFF